MISHNEDLVKALKCCSHEDSDDIYWEYVSRATQLLLLLNHWDKSQEACRKVFGLLDDAIDAGREVESSLPLNRAKEIVERALKDLEERPDELWEKWHD